MFEGGLNRRPIARLLGVPEDVVSSWVKSKDQPRQHQGRSRNTGEFATTPDLDAFRERWGMEQGATIWIPLDPPEWKVDDNPWELLYYRVSTIVGDRVAVVLPTGTRETAYHTSLASIEALASAGELLTGEQRPWYELQICDFCRKHNLSAEVRLVARIGGQATWVDEMRGGNLLYRAGGGNYGVLPEDQAVGMLRSGELGTTIALQLHRHGLGLRYPRPDDADVMALARVLEKHLFVSGNRANRGTPRECKVWRALARSAKEGNQLEWASCLQDCATVYSRAGDARRVVAAMVLIWLLTVDAESPIFQRWKLHWMSGIPAGYEEGPLEEVTGNSLTQRIGAGIIKSGVGRLLR